jgi:hypothetical protein
MQPVGSLATLNSGEGFKMGTSNGASEAEGDAVGTDPYVECPVRRIELAREIGSPARVAKLNEDLERRLASTVAEANRKRLDLRGGVRPVRLTLKTAECRSGADPLGDSPDFVR